MSSKPKSPARLADLKDTNPSTLKGFRDSLVKALDSKQESNVPQNELLIYSPSGFVYAVTVSDDGVLATVLRSTP